MATLSALLDGKIIEDVFRDGVTLDEWYHSYRWDIYVMNVAIDKSNNLIKYKMSAYLDPTKPRFRRSRQSFGASYVMPSEVNVDDRI